MIARWSSPKMRSTSRRLSPFIQRDCRRRFRRELTPVAVRSSPKRLVRRTAISASSSVPTRESTNASSASVQRRQRLQRPHVPQRGGRPRMEVGGARPVWRSAAGATLPTSFPIRGARRGYLYLPCGSLLVGVRCWGRDDRAAAQRRGRVSQTRPERVASAFQRRPVVTARVSQERVRVKSNDRRNLVRLGWDKAKNPVVQIEVGGHPATGPVH
jgi:hypothetical protein